jgi:uncharacterized protein YecE (DUF72 family)
VASGATVRRGPRFEWSRIARGLHSAPPCADEGPEDMTVHLGCSGWQYADWKGRLYPRGLAQAHWLEHYAERFETVEVNSAFYRLPEVGVFERWAAATPSDFLFSVKASRYLTHVRRLREPREPVQRLMERASGLGTKLGPILLQLPPNLRFDAGALRATLEAFPSRVRVAVEPRHESWQCDAFYDLLCEYNSSFCLSDRAGRPSPLRRTADWGYLRLHEGRASPPPCYGRSALNGWAARLADLWGVGADLFVYFNNDRGGCAVRDAHRFALALDKVGLRATRVPSARQASLVPNPA